MTAKAQVAAHLKPTFEFGISLLKQTADIFLELDTYAELDLLLTAAANASASTGGTGSNSTSTSTGAGVGGSVDIFAGLSVNAGADADLFGIFKVNDKVSLFDKSFDLFKKSFGNSFQRRDRRAGGGNRALLLSPFEQSRRNRRRGVVPANAAVERRRVVRKSGKGFSCPSSPLNGLAPIASEKVDGAR